MSVYMTVAEAADYIRLKPKTLDNWRFVNKGPTFYKAGGRVLYAVDDLDRWVRESGEKGDE